MVLAPRALRNEPTVAIAASGGPGSEIAVQPSPSPSDNVWSAALRSSRNVNVCEPAGRETEPVPVPRLRMSSESPLGNSMNALSK